MSNVSNYNGMTPFEYKKWKLRHELICQSIKEKSDFNLDKINKQVEQILGAENDNNNR